MTQVLSTRRLAAIFTPLALFFALPASQAQAGTITVSYALAGGSIDLSAPHVSPTAGTATFVFSAFRFTPAAPRTRT